MSMFDKGKLKLEPGKMREASGLGTLVSLFGVTTGVVVACNVFDYGASA